MDNSNKNKGAIKIFLGLTILAIGIYSSVLHINVYIGYLSIFIGPLIAVKGFKDYYRKFPMNKKRNLIWSFLTVLSLAILLVGQYMQEQIQGTCRWGTPQINPWCDLGLWLAIIPAIGMLIYLIVLFRMIVDKNV